MNQLILKADRLFVKVNKTSTFQRAEKKRDEHTGEWYATGKMMEGKMCSFSGKTQMNKGQNDEKGFFMVYWGDIILNNGWYTDCTLRITNIKDKKTNQWSKNIELMSWKRSPQFDIEETQVQIPDINLAPVAPKELIGEEELLPENDKDSKEMEWFDDEKQ